MELNKKEVMQVISGNDKASTLGVLNEIFTNIEIMKAENRILKAQLEMYEHKSVINASSFELEYRDERGVKQKVKEVALNNPYKIMIIKDRG